jgi:hypothetical protein
MKKNTPLVIAAAAAGALAGSAAVFGLRRLGGKRYPSFPFGYVRKFKRTVNVDRPAAEIYESWRSLKHIPQFVDNLSVDALDETNSRWTLKLPGTELSWDAEITVDRKNEMIGWRTLDGSAIANAGSIRFEPADGGRSTLVRVALQYNPPGGKAGAALAALLGGSPEDLVARALLKFKRYIEGGGVPAAEERLSRMAEEIDAASEDSFPASDAPAWTGTTGPTSPRR